MEVAPEVGELIGDRRRFEQILINLVSNGLKFTRQGGVRLECAVDGRNLVTRVIDTGIGIRPEDMEKLFRPFQQIDGGLARNHEGTGLGLSICKRLVEKLGGQIGAESQWGVGSVFTFTLPLSHD
jgi:signal transduction histidine kinase